MELSNFKKQNNVYISGNSMPGNHFEKAYLSLRQKEHRVYSNAELAGLPGISNIHPNYKEWQVRKYSAKRLLQYLGLKKSSLQILEVGCGNGWLCNQLAQIPRSEVLGLDINLTELEQAAAVFTNKNLAFMYGEITKNVLAGLQFDVIVFAASISYFPSLKEVIQTALQYLQPAGEIHIIDTFFHKEPDMNAAKQRSKDYFTKMGFPGMTDHYFHHCINDLEGFNYSFKKSSGLIQRLFGAKPIFPWVCIKPTPPPLPGLLP